MTKQAAHERFVDAPLAWPQNFNEPARGVVARALEGDGEQTAEAVMELGPSTIRADTELEPLAERMRTRDLTSLPVTTPEGELMGVVRRDDLEAELASRQS